MEDGFFTNSKNNLLKIIFYIRKYQPKIILSNPIHDRHPDHGRAAALVIKATFLAGLSKIQTFDKNQKQKEWKVHNLYHYILWDIIKPDFIINVSGFQNNKLESCMAYSSQFYNKNYKKSTPITSKNFQESILYRMKDFGRIIGVDYGEGFNSSRIIAINNIFNLI